MISLLLAHQGGWDEALLVAAPMAVVGWLLWLAKRRMTRTETEAAERLGPQNGRSDDDFADQSDAMPH